MKKYFFMQPRQTGKTTKAMYEYVKDPENTIFVTYKHINIKKIHDKVGGNIKNFVSSGEFINRTKGITLKNVILDEYMFFDNKESIYKEIIERGAENIFIHSTSNKIYNKNLFDLVKENKEIYSFNELLKKYDKTYDK